jgi:two-component system LytT family response regulator
MRIIFCDDDIRILDQLEKYVKEFFKTMGGKQPEFASYHSGDALLASDMYADIAFLDVEMPGRSGIHIGAQLKIVNPRVKIFIVTSYPDYLDEAMRFQVFRYLSKPIDKNRLFRNLKDAMYQYNMDTHEIPINTCDGVVILPAEEIVCVETVQRKNYVYTSKEIIRTVDSMEHLRSALSLPCFYTPYRSYIINLHYVISIKKDLIVLRCGEKTKDAYLSRRRYTDFKDTYLLFLESIK